MDITIEERHALFIEELFADTYRYLRLEEIRMSEIGETLDPDSEVRLRDIKQLKRAFGLGRAGVPYDETARFVSEYMVTREYGGPEEGGWWYDDEQFNQVVTVAGLEDEAYAKARELNAEAKEEEEHPLSSVANTGSIRYVVEWYPGAKTTIGRPHYC